MAYLITFLLKMKLIMVHLINLSIMLLGVLVTILATVTVDIQLILITTTTLDSNTNSKSKQSTRSFYSVIQFILVIVGNIIMGKKFHFGHLAYSSGSVQKIKSATSDTYKARLNQAI